MRYLCANTHPDHDTIWEFRRQNQALLRETFVRVLELAAELKLARFGTVAIDGTKIAAHASKPSAVSYGRAGELLAQLELEVETLLAKAEAADRTPLQDGLTIPEEIARRAARQAKLQAAREIIEERARQRAAAAQPAYAAKVAARQAQREAGKKPRGQEPQPPSAAPQPKDQFNFTDPQSRIMKAGSGDHFEQAYNAQAGSPTRLPPLFPSATSAVDTASLLIAAARVSDAPNDKEQLGPTLAAVPATLGPVREVLVDSGFFREAAVRGSPIHQPPLVPSAASAVEQSAAGEPPPVRVYAALERQSHHRGVSELEARPEPEAPPPGAGVAEVMRHRVTTSAGRAKYGLRKQTVEPVFGIIPSASSGPRGKEALGFRRFLLRGLEQVSLEWTLVSLAWNFKRLATLGLREKLARAH